MRKFYILSITLLLVLPIFNVRAQTVDILWQGEVYTSPFYKGKSLWSSQSRITMLAVPQGLGNPSALNYKWTKNGTVLGNISGVGKNSLSFVDSVLSKPQLVKVDIVGSNETILATASTNVVPIRPVLIVYENNPLYGFMFNKSAEGTYKLKEKEVSFTAFPFFFSTSDRENSLVSYEWRTNVGVATTKNSVTYRVPDESSGSSKVTLQVTSRNNIMQSADKNFLIEFGSTNTGI